MTTDLTEQSLSENLFKLKQKNTQTTYLCFSLANIYYAINIQNIIEIIDEPNLVYLSHMSPPIIGMQHYNMSFIPVLDFAGYRPYSVNGKLLVLSSNHFRQEHPFSLVVDKIVNLTYFKHDELVKNTKPFDELLPALYFAHYNDKKIFFIDVQDLANQID